MRNFLDKDFLLSNNTARILYHEYAEKMPVIDYHCHIDPKEIYDDQRFENITELWLSHDHYKWRIMRSNGVAEKYITGDAQDREKFQKFAETLPRCIGNPMYHWCHLELKRYFGYEGVLNAETAQTVWNLTKKKLAEDNTLSARGLIQQSNVVMIGTTDDPLSGLEWHKRLNDDGFPVKVCPTFRPDPALNIHKEAFGEYIARLGEITGIHIQTSADVKKALTVRMEYFNSIGCKASDHGLDRIIFRKGSSKEIDAILAKGLTGSAVSEEEAEIYQTDILAYCAGEYKRLGWIMQLHFSCMRNPNSRGFARLGFDSGFDSIAVTDSCVSLYRLMDSLDKDNALPKTILYSLNPADNEWIDTLLGAFQEEGISGKVQHGSAWWFNDNKSGMRSHMTSLANLGILGNFIGMLTDSRSFLSYTRHEYFRRILCDLVGGWIENGEYPADIDYAGKLIQDICTNNVKQYFNL